MPITAVIAVAARTRTGFLMEVTTLSPVIASVSDLRATSSAEIATAAASFWLVASRPELLAKSGIGVDGPYLVIAPPGNPVISLDSRLLDRIELIGRSPTSALVLSAAAVGGALAGAFALIPGGLFASAGLAYL